MLVVSTMAIILGALILQGPHALVEEVFGSGATIGNLDISSRQEIWQRALYAIQDFPFTGVGLDQFEPVVRLLYPLFTIGPDTPIKHAHNMFLQMAVDFGLAGLVAYSGILAASALMFVRAYRSATNPMTRALLLGFAAGLLAHVVYGVSDAITLGAKPTFEWWWSLAMLGGINARLTRTEGRSHWPRISALEVLASSALSSLVAIAVVGDNALVGVALALSGGCIFGLLAFAYFESRRHA